MKTFNAKTGEIAREWYLVDAEGQTLGRLATAIADTLRGKNKPQYTPHVDTGDFVVVVNAEKIAVTGKKLDEKIYYRHSGYPGGLKERTLRDQLERRPTEVLRKAVKGMLPRNRTTRRRRSRCRWRRSERGRAVPGNRKAEDVSRPCDPAPRRRNDVVQRAHDRGVLSAARPPAARARAAQGREPRGPLRHPRACARRRPERPGGRRSPRDRARARR